MIAALADGWIRARPPAGPLSGLTPVQTVPPELADLITGHPDHRGRALKQAKKFLALPTMTGIALDVVLDFDEVAANTCEHPDWDIVITPLPIHLRWSSTMSADWDEHSDTEVNCIVLEDGEWNVATFFSDDEERLLDQLFI